MVNDQGCFKLSSPYSLLISPAFVSPLSIPIDLKMNRRPSSSELKGRKPLLLPTFFQTNPLLFSISPTLLFLLSPFCLSPLGIFVCESVCACIDYMLPFPGGFCKESGRASSHSLKIAPRSLQSRVELKLTKIDFNNEKLCGKEKDNGF